MLKIICALIIYSFLHNLLNVIFSYLMGVEIKEISFGMGPTIIQKNILKIRLIPLSGYVRCIDSKFDEDSKSSDLKDLRNKPVLIQFVLPISACLVTLFMSVLIVGDGVVSPFLNTFRQIIIGAISPFFVAQNLLDKLIPILENESFLYLLTIIATKGSAANLFPLPSTNGFLAISALIEKKHFMTTTWWIVLMALTCIFFFLSWSSAFLYFIWRNISG